MDVLPKVEYVENPSNEYWWCTIHKRRATHIVIKDGHQCVHCCDPKLGGIMLPCSVELRSKEI